MLIQLFTKTLVSLAVIIYVRLLGLVATSESTELPNRSFQHRHFYTAYDLALMTVSWGFINPLSKFVFQKPANVKNAL